jgi:hypothetical protein
MPQMRLPALQMLSLLLIAAGCTASAQSRTFPAQLDSYFTDHLELTAGERQRLVNGQPVTKLVHAEASKEVAVFGAVWVNAPMRRYVEAITDIETFERGGGFKKTRRISHPPRLEDFAELRLPDEDIQALRNCRVGKCDVKLDEAALKRFQSEVDGRAPNPRPAADALMQQLACEYVSRYLAGGNEQLAVYRDKARPTFVAQEFRTIVDRMPELTTLMPETRRYLLEFPRVTMEGATSLLYWQETDFGLKPTIRISHLMIREGAQDTVVASKMLYASHYFWTGLELRVLLPDPARGNGFWFATMNRSRSDGLSGFTGLFVRGRVRSEVESAMMSTLRSTKQRLETPR